MFARLLCLPVLLVAFAAALPAQTAGKRQYYASWTKHTTKPYYYRQYHYKSSPSAKSYSYHYGIYYPSRGKRVYMYNPTKKAYWGYWDGDKYSLLAAEHRKALLDDIDADSFPKPGAAPKIPESSDDEKMLAPPDDFPSREDTRTIEAKTKNPSP